MRAHLRAVAASVLGEEPHLPSYEGSGSRSSSSSGGANKEQQQRLQPGSSKGGVGKAGGEAPPRIGSGEGVVALGSKVRVIDVARMLARAICTCARALAHASAHTSAGRPLARRGGLGGGCNAAGDDCAAAPQARMHTAG